MPLDITVLSLHSEWILRILVAALCGCLIGYERSSRNKEAGIRTHAIVSLGAALIMLVSKYGFIDVAGYDASRVAAQIVSGVGFLGAGVIFVKHGTVSGLTTAAGMWVTSGVGMCIGAGLYDVGVLTTLMIVGFQTLFHKAFFLRMTQSSQSIQLEIEYQEDALKDIQDTFYKNGITIHSMKVENINSHTMYLEMETTSGKEFNRDHLLQEMVYKTYLKKMSYA